MCICMWVLAKRHMYLVCYKGTDYGVFLFYSIIGLIKNDN